MNNKGLLIVLSGPSGSGKDTILEKLFKSNDNITKSISATTRSVRENEIDGKDYIFVSEKKFKDMILNGEILEYTKYCDNYYGTLKKSVNTLREEGKDVILKIEVDGAKQIREKCNDSISIFILPPSMEVLTDRLIKRATETEESLKKRLLRAREEIKYSPEYDYIIVNNSIEKSIEDITSIINAEKLKSSKMKNIINEVLL